MRTLSGLASGQPAEEDPVEGSSKTLLPVLTAEPARHLLGEYFSQDAHSFCSQQEVQLAASVTKYNSLHMRWAAYLICCPYPGL